MYCKKFRECSINELEDNPNIEFRKLLPQGVAADLGVGMLTLKGPTSIASNKHTDEQQIYLVIKGTGTVIVGKEQIRITEPTVVVIPYDTEHSVKVEEGEEMQYIYVNQFDKKINGNKKGDSKWNIDSKEL